MNYDFYTRANIAIVDREAPKIDSDFFNIPYQEIDMGVAEKYSL